MSFPTATSDKARRDLPVVMVTGYPDPAITEQVRAAGVLGYISKDVGGKFLDHMLDAARTAIAGASPINSHKAAAMAETV